MPSWAPGPSASCGRARRGSPRAWRRRARGRGGGGGAGGAARAGPRPVGLAAADRLLERGPRSECETLSPRQRLLLALARRVVLFRLEKLAGLIPQLLCVLVPVHGNRVLDGGL